jgi:hypothetical protein
LSREPKRNILVVAHDTTNKGVAKEEEGGKDKEFPHDRGPDFSAGRDFSDEWMRRSGANIVYSARLRCGGTTGRLTATLTAKAMNISSECDETKKILSERGNSFDRSRAQRHWSQSCQRRPEIAGLPRRVPNAEASWQ